MSKFPKSFKSSDNIIINELFPLIHSLDDSDVTPSETLPGTGPIFKSDDGDVLVNNKQKEFARGTTWDFGGVVFDGEEMKKIAGIIYIYIYLL